MSETERDLVVETVREMLGRHGATVRAGGWDAALWTALAGSGMTGIGLPADLGGADGDLEDAAAVVRTLAAGAAAVPAAEHLLVAGPAAAGSGLGPSDPASPTTVVLDGAVDAEPAGPDRVRLTGTVADVPWAGVATRALVVATVAGSGPVLALAELPDGPVERRSLADEPRGTVRFDGTGAAAVPLTAGATTALHARAALARAVQLSGALGEVLDRTVRYAGERVQFGRSLSRFQAVQMDLARMAAEVAAATALTESAVRAWAGADLSGAPAPVAAAAAAKIRAGEAAGAVARSAHQIHGAIGFTEEHPLHRLTRRLWTWRDDAGGEAEWSAVLGAELAEGPDALWPRLVTAV